MSNKIERPLSPHLQVYRLPYNALMSISGRGAGIVLSISLMVLCLWFAAIIWNPSLYEATMSLLDHSVFSYVFLLWAFGVFFYVGNGIRHFLWDQLIGVNQQSGIMTGNIVLLVSVILTLGLWQVTCGCWAGNSTDQTVLEVVSDAE